MSVNSQTYDIESLEAAVALAEADGAVGLTNPQKKLLNELVDKKKEALGVSGLPKPVADILTKVRAVNKPLAQLLEQEILSAGGGDDAKREPAPLANAARRDPSNLPSTASYWTSAALLGLGQIIMPKSFPGAWKLLALAPAVISLGDDLLVSKRGLSQRTALTTAIGGTSALASSILARKR